jgi:hypothetical protein
VRRLSPTTLNFTVKQAVLLHLVEAYRKTLKPSDILDDDPGPFMLAI